MPESFGTPFERLSHLASKLDTNLSQMSLRLGKPRQYLGSYKNKSSNYGYSILKQLQMYYDINPDFIQYGRKPEFMSEHANLVGLRPLKLIPIPELKSLTIDQIQELVKNKEETLRALNELYENAETVLAVYESTKK